MLARAVNGRLRYRAPLTGARVSAAALRTARRTRPPLVPAAKRTVRVLVGRRPDAAAQRDRATRGRGAAARGGAQRWTRR